MDIEPNAEGVKTFCKDLYNNAKSGLRIEGKLDSKNKIRSSCNVINFTVGDNGTMHPTYGKSTFGSYENVVEKIKNFMSFIDKTGDYSAKGFNAVG